MPLSGLSQISATCVEQDALHLPAVLGRGEAAFARLLEGIHQLAIDVELELLVRGVADAHRLGVGVARQPVDFPFGEPPLAAQAVHDLHLVGRARDGALQPVAPGRGLVVDAGVHHGEQGERGVAQPAQAVVPVALAAELLGQRRRGRRDDAAARQVDQALERDQRALDRLACRGLRPWSSPSSRARMSRTARAPPRHRPARARSRCEGP